MITEMYYKALDKVQEYEQRIKELENREIYVNTLFALRQRFKQELSIEKEKLIFTGDTLFSGTWGRTDLITSSFEDIINSITKKIIVLPEDTIIYPGHGKSTIIKEEKPIYLDLKPRLDY